MDLFVSRASRLRGLLCVLACAALLMGADRRVDRVPAATGELTLLSGTAGTFDVVAANAGLHGYAPFAVAPAALGAAELVDGVIHYTADAQRSGVDRVGYQLVNASGQRRLGELRVRVVDAQAAVPMRVQLAVASRGGVRVELREGSALVAEGHTRGNGTVDLAVPAGWPGDAMLSLHAEGVGAAGDALRWVSLLGSAQQLRIASAGGRLDPVEWPALHLGAASTAFHAVLTSIDAHAATSEDAAMRAAPGVDPYRLLSAAALVDLMEAGTLSLPPGYVDTYALVKDDAEVYRLRSLHWEIVNPVADARLTMPARSPALPARPYVGWFTGAHANGLPLGDGYSGMALHAGGGGEYLSRADLQDTGLQWHPHEGGLRVELNQPRIQQVQGYSSWCELADGSVHNFMVLRFDRRGTVDLRRVHGFAGTDYLVQRWQRVRVEELQADVPEDCEVSLMPDQTWPEFAYSVTRPNVDTVAVEGPAVPIPDRLLLGLGVMDPVHIFARVGLLDLSQDRLTVEGIEPGIDVHLARAGRIVFDALHEGEEAPHRYELQRLWEGVAGLASWGVVRRGPHGEVRGWITAGIEPQPVRADFDWNGFWIHARSWYQVGTLGLWRNEEGWSFNEHTQRAMRHGKTQAGGVWEAYPHLQDLFLVEDGAAVRRLYYAFGEGGGSHLLECPPGLTCWRQSEHRLFPVAELPDAFGPGRDLVFVMHERGLSEWDWGWGQFDRYINAFVREPEGSLRQATPARLMGGRDAVDGSIQRR